MTPQPVDLSPLLKLDPDLSQGLTRAFSDWEAITLAGVSQRTGKPGLHGVEEMWEKDYFSVRDGRQEWMIWVRVELHDSNDGALEWLRHECASQGETFAASPELVVDGSWRYCKTPIGQLRNDPEGGGFPSEEYVSFVGIQFDQLVLTLDETYRSDAKTAKNELIVELAERLARLGPATAQVPAR